MSLRGVDYARQQALFHLQDYARKFTKGEIQVPIQVEQIAELYFGLTIERRELPQGTSGQLFTTDRRIVLNATEPLTRQRFTVAHELGHLALHKSLVGTPICPATSFPEVETEANRYAASLLLPTNLVLLELATEVNTRAMIAKNEDRIYELTPGELDVIASRLATKFVASKTAVEILLSKRFTIRHPRQLSLEVGIENA
jgi:Zn-dependent peptidase ImmA (M78 family)